MALRDAEREDAIVEAGDSESEVKLSHKALALRSVGIPTKYEGFVELGNVIALDTTKKHSLCPIEGSSGWNVVYEKVKTKKGIQVKILGISHNTTGSTYNVARNDRSGTLEEIVMKHEKLNHAQSAVQMAKQGVDKVSSRVASLLGTKKPKDLAKDLGEVEFQFFHGRVTQVQDIEIKGSKELLSSGKDGKGYIFELIKLDDSGGYDVIVHGYSSKKQKDINSPGKGLKIKEYSVTNADDERSIMSAVQARIAKLDIKGVKLVSNLKANPKTAYSIVLKMTGGKKGVLKRYDPIEMQKKEEEAKLLQALQVSDKILEIGNKSPILSDDLVAPHYIDIPGVGHVMYDVKEVYEQVRTNGRAGNKKSISILVLGIAKGSRIDVEKPTKVKGKKAPKDKKKQIIICEVISQINQDNIKKAFQSNAWTKPKRDKAGAVISKTPVSVSFLN